MTDNAIYVKELLPDGQSPYQKHPWPLPVQDAAGEWSPGAWVGADVSQPLVECGNGLHAYTEAQAQPNLRHDRAYWVVEYAEPPCDWGEKVSGYKARLLRPYPLPAWLLSVQPAIDALAAIPWLKPDGNPDPAWRLFPTQADAYDSAFASADAYDGAYDAAFAYDGAAHRAAYDAAHRAAYDAAYAYVAAYAAAYDAAFAAAYVAAARDAARDAALYVVMTTVCADLSIAQEHRDHAEARMNVWRKGYGLLGEVGGTLYVYERVE